MNVSVDPHRQHAVFAPSSADRWIPCTASAEAIAHLPPQEEGEEAAKGTAAHDEIERVLGPYSGDGLGFWLERPDTMIASPNPSHPSAYGVALLLDYVRQLPPGRLFVEQRVHLTEHIWGRCDVAHWHEESGTLTIADYKDGYVGVDPDSAQVRIYGIASIYTHRLPAKWIRYAIVQPNDFRPVPRVKQWDESAESLYAWANKVAAIPLGPKKFVAGEHCTYCPLFGRCEATRDLLRDLSALIAGLMKAEDVTPEQRALFLACEKPIADAFKSANKAWLKDALTKAPPPGMVVVTGAKRRAWKNPAAARALVIEKLGVGALDLPTPAQAEELGLDVGELADRPQGGPVLAFEGDKRKAWVQPTGAEMFGSVLK